MALTTADIAGMRLKHLEILHQKIRFFTACRYFLLCALVISLLLAGVYGVFGALIGVAMTLVATWCDHDLCTRQAASQISYSQSITEGFETIPDFAAANLNLGTRVSFLDYTSGIGVAFVLLLLISLLHILIRLAPVS